MRRNRTAANPLGRRALLLGAALTLALPWAVFAQENAAAQPPAEAPAREAQPVPPGGWVVRPALFETPR
jgi:hypothetical protein